MSDPSPAPLPPRPSLEQLRKQAKDLLHDCQRGEADSLDRIRRHKPKVTTPVLADAQFVLAREFGFKSWAALTASLGPPALDVRNAPHGLSPRPPFYQIDWNARRLTPRQTLTESDWDTIIEVIREHGITSVSAAGAMTDAVLEKLSHIESITCLRLGGCKELTDQGLMQIGRMPQLVELDLSNYPGGVITDCGLTVLRHLPALRRIKLCWQGGISDAGVAHLAHCEHLERVDLLGSPTGNGAISALRGKHSLRHFKTGRLVTDAGLALLSDFPVFKSWRGGEPQYDLMTFGDAEPNYLVVDGPFSDAGFATLAGLEGLFGLGLFWHVSGMTAGGLKPLADLPKLGALGCQGKLCDDTAMRHIAAIPRLRMLMAQGTVATDDGFSCLSRSPTIEYIWGRECPNLHGSGFAALADMPALKGLAVSCKLVDDASLAVLPRFPALTWFLPMDVPDDGFRHIGRCPKLEQLTCMYCDSTGDIATGHIAGLSHLKCYYAGQTQITDRSLEILGGMMSLEEVDLYACARITSAGLAHIARLPHLKRFSVSRTPRVTPAGVAGFPPNVHVDFIGS